MLSKGLRLILGTRTGLSGYPAATIMTGLYDLSNPKILFRKRMGLGVCVRVASPDL